MGVIRSSVKSGERQRRGSGLDSGPCDWNCQSRGESQNQSTKNSPDSSTRTQEGVHSVKGETKTLRKVKQGRRRNVANAKSFEHGEGYLDEGRISGGSARE